MRSKMANTGAPNKMQVSKHRSVAGGQDSVPTTPGPQHSAGTATRGTGTPVCPTNWVRAISVRLYLIFLRHWVCTRPSKIAFPCV
jgi:hypothetical protein